jgi:hypothetical protein
MLGREDDILRITVLDSLESRLENSTQFESQGRPKEEGVTGSIYAMAPCELSLFVIS